MTQNCTSNNVGSFTFYDRTTDSPRTLRLFGRTMLVRRCIRNDAEFLLDYVPGITVDVTPEEAELADLMVKSFEEATPVQWAEVKAVGPKCGTPMSDHEWDRYRLPDNHKGACCIGHHGVKYSEPRCIVNPCGPGDLVLLPPQSANGTMFRGVLPGAEADDSEQSYLIVSERDAIAVRHRENADE